MCVQVSKAQDVVSIQLWFQSISFFETFLKTFAVLEWRNLEPLIHLKTATSFRTRRCLITRLKGGVMDKIFLWLNQTQKLIGWMFGEKLRYVRLMCFERNYNKKILFRKLMMMPNTGLEETGLDLIWNGLTVTPTLLMDIKIGTPMNQLI